MTKSKAYPAIVLGCICLIVAICLSGINLITAPEIAKRANALAEAAKAEVLPGGKDFKDITDDFEFPEGITEAHSADIGFVFRSTGKGRNGDIVVMVGVSLDGKITGTKVITEGESKGYKEKVYSIVEGTDGGYTGQTLEGFEPVIASGATMTSNGFAEAVKAALQAHAIALGGSVDLRTPEQILQDNCNVALGTEKKTFTRWFATEVIEGVDAVYESEDGRVYVIGEAFVGIKADGTVVTADASEENKTAATAANTIIANAGELISVEKPSGASQEVTGVKKTNSGNYVFELSAKGFDVSHKYSDGNINGNPKPIVIKLSISADGKIIDAQTVTHSESKGYGDACASDEYRNQWAGATEDNVENLGVISGATYTTQGYQKAVKAAFAAFEMLTEGGNQ